MNQALLAAQQILTGLGDIHPVISVKGLDNAATVIRDLKKNAAVLVTALTPPSPRLKEVLDSARKDVDSSFKGLIETIPFESTNGQISDEQIMAMGAAAEMFARRCHEYASCKESYNAMVKHNVNSTEVAAHAVQPQTSEGYYVD